MDTLPIPDNAFPAIEDVRIVVFGKMEDRGGITDWCDLEVVDAEGRSVLPYFCDSHTHLVFDSSRQLEFEDRIKRMTSDWIAVYGASILA